MSDATEAIVDIIEAIEEYGSAIVITKPGTEVRDAYGNLITPAVPSVENTKALISRVATDKLLSKLTQDEKNSYSLSLRLYTTQVLNKTDYTITFRSKEYQIYLIDEMVLQDETLIYEILLKR